MNYICHVKNSSGVDHHIVTKLVILGAISNVKSGGLEKKDGNEGGPT